METAISQINNFPITKTEQSNFIAKLVQEIESGCVSPLDCELSLKSLENIIKEVKERVKDYIQNEAAKYEKTFEYRGVKISQAQKTTYDFSNSDDELYLSLKKQENEIKEQIKIRESQLKSGIDAVTGEALTKPITKISNFLTITFPK